MDFEKRILLVDDNQDIHEDFRKILMLERYDPEFEKARSIIFDTPNTDELAAHQQQFYHIDSAYQGQEALELVKNSLSDRRPYALAFIDIRMPPGWDGIETIKHIWQVDPEIQVVICTAHSDYSWENIVKELGSSDNFLVLKKPFDPIEIFQFAVALTKKWELKKLLMQQLESIDVAVKKRADEFSTTKENLFMLSCLMLKLINPT